MLLPKIILKKKEEKRILNGHRWVFANEVERSEGEITNGGIVDVHSHQHEFLGRGFVNKNSLICVRMLTRILEEIDTSFFCKRIGDAYTFRQSLYPREDSYRVVYGESDFLPGLIVDKYGNYLVLQVLSLGMEKLLPMIAVALTEVFSPKGVYLRNDVEVRSLEGLALEKKVFLGTEPPAELVVRQQELKFMVDVVAGQKTGFFFDQRENRMALAGYCPGKTVLDCFCYSGGFAIAAAYAGAEKVTGVDVSAEAIDLCVKNSSLNRLAERCEFIESDVFDFLSEAVATGKQYDVVNVDPPSFTKTKKNLPQAIKGYRKLNVLAMCVVKKGGIMASSSCSHYMDEDTFIAVLRANAWRAGRTVRVLEVRGQSRDHPMLLAMPETKYLKYIIMEIL